MPIAIYAVAHIGLEFEIWSRAEMALMSMSEREPGNRRLTFGRDNAFQSELRRRVDEYFRYLMLVFVAATWWQALPLAIMLGLSMAAIGFNIEHDGGHQAYSNHAWVNRLMAMTMDLIGASSYVWHWKHVVVHHTYTNLTGHDADIELGFLGRLTPHQK